MKYTIVGGAPAEFAPTGSQEAEAVTNADGQATVQLRQVAGQFETGTTQIRVDVIRPRIFGESELKVESSITSVTWSAPALKIRAIGPRTAGINEAFNYRVEVSNPGDQLTRGVLLNTRDFPEGLEFVSSTPKPTVLGRELQWQLGDILPGSPPRIVDIQLKSNTRGQNELCFEVSSQSDQLKTEACAQTEISVPCLGLQIEGPDAARVGDQVKFNIAILNQCDDPLEGIELQIQYDPGLLATGLGNPIRTNIANLKPGERKEIPVVFDVVRAGRHCFNLSITARGGHTARATECVVATPATAAALTLELSGRSRIDRGSRVLIRGVVANNGNVSLGNITLTNRFADSLEPRRVTEQYPHRWLGTTADELIFDLGRLDPGQSRSVEIIYDALAVDGDAFSEFTVSSPDLSPITRRYDLRIEPTGTIGDPGGLGLESGGVDPGLQPPPQGSGPALVIPDDPGGGALDPGNRLQATARALDRQASVNSPARMQFEIRNGSSQSDTNVNISLLVPPSMQLANVLDDLGNEIPIVSRSRDFTRLDLEPRREMRPGDSLIIIATLIATQPGSSFVEIQATSDDTAGLVTAGDSIAVIP